MLQWKKPELPVRVELAFAAGVIAGVGAFAAGFSIAGVAIIAGFLVAAGWLLPPKIALSAAIGAILGVSATFFYQRSLKFDDLPERNVYGSFQVQITDRRITTVPGIPSPRLISVKLLSRKLIGENNFQPIAGTVLLRLPDTEQTAPPVGSIAEITGELQIPKHSAVRRVNGKIQIETAATDFAAYLAGRGSARVLAAEQITIKAHSAGFDAQLCRIRDAILSRTLSQVTSDSVRHLTAALFFGVSGGLSNETRRIFINSGTAHLFSVSGIHVAILSGLLLLALRLTPFKIRYPLLATLVLLYVLTTGANAPALRAFYMIAIMCLLRTLLLYTPAVNTLLLTAALMLLVNPALVTDIGFQYSFIITGVLIIASERFHQFKLLANEQLSYMLGKERKVASTRVYRLNQLLFAIFSCTAAFAAGLAITLRSSGLLLPGSIIVNLLLIPIVALLFPVLFLKLALSFCGSTLNAIGAWLLSMVFKLLNAITQSAVELFSNIPAVRPSLLEVWLFGLGLLLLLGVKSRRIAILGGGLIFLLVFSWIGRVWCEPPRVIAMAGGQNKIPLIAIAEPARHLAIAINLPGSDSGAMLAKLLRKYGITQLEALYPTQSRKENIVGIPSLIRALPIKRIVLPKMDQNNGQFTDFIEQHAPDTPLTPQDRNKNEFCHFIDQKNRFEVEYFNPGSTFKIVIFIDKCDSGWRFTLRSPHTPDSVHILPYGSVLEIWEHEF